MKPLAQRLNQLLDEKLALCADRSRCLEHIATNPRPSIKDALREELHQIDAQILLVDERFHTLYAQYRLSLPLTAGGEIDTAALSPRRRDELYQIRERVRKISAFPFQNPADTLR